MSTYLGDNIDDLDITTPTEGNTPPSELNDAIREIKNVYKNQHKIVSKTGAYTLTENDHVVLCDGTFTLTLPAIATVSGSGYIKEYVIINIGTGTITIDGNGSEKIDGFDTIELISDWRKISLYGDGTNWYTSGLTIKLGDPAHNQFGSWASKVDGTVYQAATDGFVLATGGSNNTISIYSDAGNPPTVTRAKSYAGGAYDRTVMCPILKDDYWKTENANINVRWVPVG